MRGSIGCLTVLMLAAGAPAGGEEMTSQQTLNGAAARIEQHRKGNATLAVLGPDGRPMATGTKLSIEQTRHEFLFGACAQWLFNIHSRENRFETEPEKARAYARHFAELLNFWAREHGMPVKGHPLAWNWFGEPRYLAGKSAEEVVAMQVDRIERMLERLKGKVTMWDVVNEAAAYDRTDAHENGPQLTKAMDEIGVEEYVRTMHATARKADPTATLLTNDYVLDERYEKRGIDPVLGEGEALFDVIGIQSHMHGGAWPVERMWSVCERFARYGKPLHFTEVTITSGESDGRRKRSADPGYKWGTTPEGEERQAAEVARLYTVLFSHPAVEAITWWNLTDDRAWRQAPAGLLRADMTPKPAYDELKRLVKGAWWTTTSADVGDRGRLEFRGFYGDYKLTATGRDGETLTGTFRLSKGSPEQASVVRLVKVEE